MLEPGPVMVMFSKSTRRADNSLWRSFCFVLAASGNTTVSVSAFVSYTISFYELQSNVCNSKRNKQRLYFQWGSNGYHTHSLIRIDHFLIFYVLFKNNRKNITNLPPTAEHWRWPRLRHSQPYTCTFQHPALSHNGSAESGLGLQDICTHKILFLSFPRLLNK